MKGAQMLDKIGHIKNPLTIIAIFAAIAEVSASVALPLIDKDVQKIFVWFLIGFPSGLVILFFGTLWFNHQVLYAPSDYANEDNFLYGVRPATKVELIKEIVKQAESEESSQDEESVLPPENDDSSINDLPPNKDAELAFKQNQQLQIANIEEFLLLWAERKFGKIAIRNPTFQSSNGKSIVFDAAIGSSHGIVLEIIVRLSRPFTKSSIEHFKKRIFEKIWTAFNDHRQIPRFIIVFAAYGQRPLDFHDGEINRAGGVTIESFYIDLTQTLGETVEKS